MNAVKVLICPSGNEEIIPMKVWESRLPDGRMILYGQFQPHTHYGQECEWLLLVQPLVERNEVFPSVSI